MSFFKNYKNIDHIVRLFLLYVLILIGFLAARSFLVPKSYGEFGSYRGVSPKEVADSPVIYQGESVCGNCHAEQVQKKTGSKHQNVRCEVCHGAGNKHAENPLENKPLKLHNREFCLFCHGSNPSRPKNFPQIKSELHNAGMGCALCHDPHHPDIK